ncbi:MAG: hypothetical protein K2Y37_05540 [Pirellulales bacterium]|nr:hypothetical protein [Pirellulales bacterium]
MRLTFLALVSATLSSACLQGARTAEPLPEPDPEIQRELNLASEQLGEMERGAPTEKLAAALGSLAPLLKRDGESILRQMVLFYPQATQKQRFALMFIRDLLVLPSGAELGAIAPFVDAEDEKLRSVALDMLAATARRGSLLVPNLEPFLLHLSGRGRDKSSERLIRFIFKLDPCQALDGMERFGFVRVRGGDADVALRGHVIANGIWLDRADVFFRDKEIHAKLREAMPQVEQALFELAGNDTWWVRLCAAEVVRKYERFRTEKVMERLRGDKHQAILDVLDEIRAAG